VSPFRPHRHQPAVYRIRHPLAGARDQPAAEPGPRAGPSQERSDPV